MIKKYVEHQGEDTDAFNMWDADEKTEEKKELKPDEYPDKNGLEP